MKLRKRWERGKQGVSAPPAGLAPALATTSVSTPINNADSTPPATAVSTAPSITVTTTPAPVLTPPTLASTKRTLTSGLEHRDDANFPPPEDDSLFRSAKTMRNDDIVSASDIGQRAMSRFDADTVDDDNVDVVQRDKVASRSTSLFVDVEHDTQLVGVVSGSIEIDRAEADESETRVEQPVRCEVDLYCRESIADVDFDRCKFVESSDNASAARTDSIACDAGLIVGVALSGRHAPRCLHGMRGDVSSLDSPHNERAADSAAPSHGDVSSDVNIERTAIDEMSEMQAYSGPEESRPVANNSNLAPDNLQKAIQLGETRPSLTELFCDDNLIWAGTSQAESAYAEAVGPLPVGNEAESVADSGAARVNVTTRRALQPIPTVHSENPTAQQYNIDGTIRARETEQQQVSNAADTDLIYSRVHTPTIATDIGVDIEYARQKGYQSPISGMHQSVSQKFNVKPSKSSMHGPSTAGVNIPTSADMERQPTPALPPPARERPSAGDGPALQALGLRTEHTDREQLLSASDLPQSADVGWWQRETLTLQSARGRATTAGVVPGYASDVLPPAATYVGSQPSERVDARQSPALQSRPPQPSADAVYESSRITGDHPQLTRQSPSESARRIPEFKAFRQRPYALDITVPANNV